MNTLIPDTLRDQLASGRRMAQAQRTGTHTAAVCLDVSGDAIERHDWQTADRWLERYETARRQHGETAQDRTRAVRYARAVLDALTNY